jgi:hypothetical protein
VLGIRGSATEHHHCQRGELTRSLTLELGALARQTGGMGGIDEIALPTSNRPVRPRGGEAVEGAGPRSTDYTIGLKANNVETRFLV